MIYDEPVDLATLVAAAPRPLLIGLDIDGVLSPIVAHADDARLVDGVADELAALGSADHVVVAAVSGRAVASMRTFGLPDVIRLVGSHGLEEHDAPMFPLDDEEQERLDRLRELADETLAVAGAGAWVEQKSASVAFHVREAAPKYGRRAIEKLERTARLVVGAHAKHGNQVLELFTREASKGAAMRRLADETGASTSVFVGDDITDEDAFAVLVGDDIAIKVGDAKSIAPNRLRDPHAVLEWLQSLTVAVGS